MSELNATAAAVLIALRMNAEGYSKADEWGDVYLDNARPANLTTYQFRAALSSLAKAGLYKVIDGFAWGSVKQAN